MNNLKPDFPIIISHIYELRMENFSLYGYLIDYDEKEATELIQNVELISNLLSALFEATKKAYFSADMKIYQKMFTQLQDITRKMYVLADMVTQTTSLSEDENLQKAEVKRFLMRSPAFCKFSSSDMVTQTTSLSEDENLQKAGDRIKNLLTSQSSSNPIRH